MTDRKIIIELCHDSGILRGRVTCIAVHYCIAVHPSRSLPLPGKIRGRSVDAGNPVSD